VTQWRPATAADDEAIVTMSLALYDEDPSPSHVTDHQVRATLERLRQEPVRGRAIVLDVDGTVAGYALLVSFWSNELGGEIRTIDEIYVAPAWRRRGLATVLIESLCTEHSSSPGRPIALELEVSPGNPRARRLYERLGFRAKRNTTLRRDLR
jgi:GNAT superfamily N-acetyltransferase